jgi:hypothetical protein
MRFLFVSPEQVVRQKYRRGIAFRLSAVCVFLGLAAQIPIFVRRPGLEVFYGGI